MLSNTTPTGFALHDLLTRLIPGAVLVAPLITAFLLLSQEMYQITSVALILIALASYLLGEIIEHLRSGWFRVPTPFLNYYYELTGNLQKMPWWYRKTIHIDERTPGWFPKFWFHPDEKSYPKFWFHSDVKSDLPTRLDFNFQSSMESRYDIELQNVTPRDVYDLLLLDLEAGMSRRTRRHQSLYQFSRNLLIACALSLTLYIVEFFAFRSVFLFIALVALILLLCIIILISRILKLVPYFYVEMLFKEYYIQEQNRTTANP